MAYTNELSYVSLTMAIDKIINSLPTRNNTVLLVNDRPAYASVPTNYENLKQTKSHIVYNCFNKSGFLYFRGDSVVKYSSGEVKLRLSAKSTQNSRPVAETYDNSLSLSDVLINELNSQFINDRPLTKSSLSSTVFFIEESNTNTQLRIINILTKEYIILCHRIGNKEIPTNCDEYISYLKHSLDCFIEMNCWFNSLKVSSSEAFSPLSMQYLVPVMHIFINQSNPIFTLNAGNEIADCVKPFQYLLSISQYLEKYTISSVANVLTKRDQSRNIISPVRGFKYSYNNVCDVVSIFLPQNIITILTRQEREVLSITKCGSSFRLLLLKFLSLFLQLDFPSSVTRAIKEYLTEKTYSCFLTLPVELTSEERMQINPLSVFNLVHATRINRDDVYTSYARSREPEPNEISGVPFIKCSTSLFEFSLSKLLLLDLVSNNSINKLSLSLLETIYSSDKDFDLLSITEELDLCKELFLDNLKTMNIISERLN